MRCALHLFRKCGGLSFCALERGGGEGTIACNGTQPGEWGDYLVDGSFACDSRPGDLPQRGGDNGADGVDVCDVDGDGDLDVVTGWEESGDVVLYLNPLHQVLGDTPREDLIRQQWQVVDARGRGTNDGPNQRKPAPFIEDAVFLDLLNPDATTGQGLCSLGAEIHTLVSAQEGTSRKGVLRTPPLGDITDGSGWAARELPDNEKYFLQAAGGDIDGLNCNDIVIGAKDGQTFPESEIQGGIWWFKCPSDPQTSEEVNAQLHGDELKVSRWNRYKIDGGRWFMNVVLSDVDGDGDNDIVFSDRRRIGWFKNPRFTQTPTGTVLGDPTRESQWTRVVIESDADIKDWCDAHNTCARGDIPGEVFRDMVYKDLDGDGLTDIVATTNYRIASDGVVARWYRRLPGNGVSWFIYEISSNNLPFTYEGLGNSGTIVSKSVDVADIDLDGDNDLVFSVRGGGHGVYALSFPPGPPAVCGGPCINFDGNNRGTWQATPLAPHYPVVKYDNVVLADFDEDCDVDAVTAEEFIIDHGLGVGVPWYENPTVSQRPAARCRNAGIQTQAGTCSGQISAAQVNLGSMIDPVFGESIGVRPAGGSGLGATSMSVPVGVNQVELVAANDCTIERLGTQSIDVCTAQVTVLDQERPVITCPAPPAPVECTGSQSAVASYPAPTAVDNCDGNLASVCSPATGSVYPLGSTNVSCSATDSSGNPAVGCGFAVVVEDTLAPEFDPLVDVEADCTAPLSPVALTAPTATDQCDGPILAVADGHPAAFPVGRTTVSWKATDSTDLMGVGTQDVIVIDENDPTITPPDDIEDSECNSTFNASTVDLGEPTMVGDLCDANPTYTNDAPAAGFPLGVTIVEWEARDESNNTATAYQSVEVVDTLAPNLIIVPVAPVECTSPAGASVNVIPPKLSDACDGAPTVSGNLLPVYPIGNTQIDWIATDFIGNSSPATPQIIVVEDTTGPSVQAPADVVAECQGPGGTLVTNLGSPVVNDVCDVAPSVSNNAPASQTYPVGPTQITWTAIDAYNNPGSDMQTVLIEDTLPPVISCPMDIVLEPTSPSGATADFDVTATDQCSATVTVACDAASGDGFPIGQTTPVNCQATDPANNMSACGFTVRILSLEELVGSLVDRADDLGLNRGRERALLAHLDNVLRGLENPTGNSVCGAMSGLLNQLEAWLANGQLPPDPGLDYLASAERLAVSSGCSP